ncbi:MAG: type II toxin-antitoxin system RelE/ParE family toxin [Acidobacteriaceae bacterium]
MKARWTEPALQHLHEAYDYVRLDKPDAAARLMDRIEAAVGQLRMFPQMGAPSARPKARQFAVSGTPFIVLYRVADNVLEILAVFHGAQNWKGNL